MARKKKPTALLVKVMFSVEAEATEPELRERLEWAINEACAAFMSYEMKQKFIRYSIKEVIELD